MKGKIKVVGCFVGTILLIFFLFYFLKPISSTLNHVNDSKEIILDKYFINKNATILFLFNEDVAYVYSENNGYTFSYKYEDGYIDSESFDFIVLDHKLWSIELKDYFYETTIEENQ